jgi:hypothetical protein
MAASDCIRLRATTIRKFSLAWKGASTDGKRAIEYPGICSNSQKGPQREPSEADEIGPREHSFEPDSAFLVLLGSQIISIEQQVSVDQDQRESVPSTCSMRSATLSRESPGLRSPRSRTVILKGCRRAATRRLANRWRSVSLTISRKGRPPRRAFALSLAAHRHPK